MKRITLILLSSLVFYSCAMSQQPIVEMETSLGNIELEIDVKNAPVTAKHFIKNIKESKFKGACFYRSVKRDNQPHNDIKIEVIQGGLFHDSIVDQMPTIHHETTDETGILHKDGVISMARNHPGSAATEFFICIGNQPELDFGGARNPDGQGFAAFGKVRKGMNIVRKIQKQKDKEQILIDPIEIISIKLKNPH